MDVEKKVELIKKFPTEEILNEDELKTLLEQNMVLKHYIGFEISGFVHLGTGLVSGTKIRDFQEAGVETSIFLADWHTWINDKLGGDLETIKKVAGGYFKDALKLSLKIVGGDPEKVDFILGSEVYKDEDYWLTVIDVAKRTTLARIKRSITILGRKEGEGIDFAKLIYPVMQVADALYMGKSLIHAGMDQRKAHVVTLEVAKKMQYKKMKDNLGNVIRPVGILHHLVLGLLTPSKVPETKEEYKQAALEVKMSKSKPKSAIFLHDGEEEIRKKIKEAFCPAKNTFFNPVLDITKTIIFPIKGELFIKRKEKFGGNVEYKTFEELEKDFKEGKLHPLDLKNGVSEALIEILEPAREHYSKEKGRKYLEEMKKIKISR